MKIIIKQLILQNFMTYAEKIVDFGNVTRIAGKNGKGKSTILTSYMWLLFNCDYELNDNPSIRKDGVEDADVSVTAVLDIDGKEVTAKKVQKRKYAKDGVGYSDDNTYFINDVPKTLRDFNTYFEVDIPSLRICSNVNAFISGKPKEMRDFLFGTVDSITDMDVALKFDDTAELRELLEKYTAEEIKAMNTASKSKVAKELPILDGQIKEAELNCTNDIDVAELCLKRNMINEQIAEVESQVEDSSKIFEDYQNKVDEINNLKKQLSDMERESVYQLSVKRQTVQDKLNELGSEFNNTRQAIKMAELSISSVSSTIEHLTSDKKDLQDKYLAEKSKSYMEYEPIGELDPQSLICPTCGQNLPEDVKAKRIEEYEVRKAQHKTDYVNAKIKFENTKIIVLEDIIKSGNAINDELKSKSEELATLNNSLSDAKEKSVSVMAEKNKVMAELNAIPLKPDMTDNMDYVNLVSDIATKSAALDSFDNGKDYRTQLKLKLDELRNGLTATEREIAKADTSVAEERLEQLRAQKLDMEQSKADCEKYLYLLELLDKHKNEELADSINSQFKQVKWKLFELNKSGGYKSVCIPTMDGRSIMDIHSNKGNRILGKLDICNSIQKISNINCPVFLDDVESLDDENVIKAIGIMDCQTVLLKVSNDTELKVEVEEC